MRKRFFSGLLLVFFIMMLSTSVLATTYADYDGLTVTIETDREQYDDGEPITATITLTNNRTQSVNVVNLEQLIPAGYELSEDSVAGKSDFEIKPGETVVLNVTMVEQPGQVVTGDVEENDASFPSLSSLINLNDVQPMTLLWVLLGLVAFGIFMYLT